MRIKSIFWADEIENGYVQHKVLYPSQGMIVRQDAYHYTFQDLVDKHDPDEICTRICERCWTLNGQSLIEPTYVFSSGLTRLVVCLDEVLSD